MDVIRGSSYRQHLMPSLLYYSCNVLMLNQSLLFYVSLQKHNVYESVYMYLPYINDI